MTVELIRKCMNGHFLNYYENDRIVFGFTEIGFKLNDLSTCFPMQQLVELKQIHSNIIRFASQIEPGMKGDGIVLDKPGIMAIIKTADCTPLFFWDSQYSIGGLIHIGWQGLLKGIEKKLVGLLKEKFIPLENLHFYLGPAIEKKCYEVGPELYEKFSITPYREAIFSYKPYPKKKERKYLMDVKKGISLSLQESGVPGHRIVNPGLCTFCEAQRFPSYRRDKGIAARIYNFLLLKNQQPLLRIPLNTRARHPVPYS
jgi:YfiH family protein